MAGLLRLDRVTAGFGPTVIIEEISLAIEQGSVLAVLGRNGVGKSTLMKTIAGHTRMHFWQYYIRRSRDRVAARLLSGARWHRLCAADA